jgi:hypothetical protein
VLAWVSDRWRLQPRGTTDLGETARSRRLSRCETSLPCRLQCVTLRPALDAGRDCQQAKHVTCPPLIGSRTNDRHGYHPGADQRRPVAVSGRCWACAGRRVGAGRLAPIRSGMCRTCDATTQSYPLLVRAARTRSLFVSVGRGGRLSSRDRTEMATSNYGKAASALETQHEAGSSRVAPHADPRGPAHQRSGSPRVHTLAEWLDAPVVLWMRCSRRAPRTR